jgi:hypothetical protein
VAPTLYEREEAVRWLGRLRDARAVEPLLSVIPEFGLRYLVAVALGEIGDARAYDALTDMLQWEERTNIRDEIVRGLGLLGDARAIEPLIGALLDEPELKHTAESLVRLDAIGRGQLGGRDIEPSLSGKGGLFECAAGPLRHDWDYLARTTCKGRGQVRLALPLGSVKADLSRGSILLVRLRRSDAAETTEIAFALDDQPLSFHKVDNNWVELRIPLEPAWLRSPQPQLQLRANDADTVLMLDHALVVPKSELHARAQTP